MKIYLSGKITNNANYKEQFKRKELELKLQGHTVINPTVLSDIPLEHNEYLHINKAMKEFIIRNAAGTDTEKLTKLLNAEFDTDFTVSQIDCLRYQLGAKSGLKTRVHNSGRFKKGQVPFNKGKKQTEYMGAEAIKRSSVTRFKKGHTPKNHRPVGSERICSKDGYVLIKVAEPKKWTAKHRYIWEKENGKIPKNHTVIFLDGDKSNLDIDNLALVPRADLVRLNQKRTNLQ